MEEKRLKNYPLKLLTTMALCWALLLTACPSDTQINKAARASYELSGITKDVVEATKKAYERQLISTELKNSIADKLVVISTGGSAFNQLATGLNRTGPIPADKYAALQTILNNQIVSPFLNILEELKAISPGQARALFAAVAALRTAILVISAVVSQTAFDRVEGATLANVRRIENNRPYRYRYRSFAFGA